MDKILDEADRLLRSGSSEDIQNFLPEIAMNITKLDMFVATNELAGDRLKVATYIKLKQQKKNGENTYSDKDIEILCKNKVLEQFGDTELDKKTVKHLELYMDLLKQRVIDLAVQNKNLREGVSM